MKDFDKRWQRLCAGARGTQAAETAPPGFATRVVACSLQKPRESAGYLWDRLALPLLGGAVAVLIACAAGELPHWRSAPLQVDIEQTVTRIAWWL